MSGDVPSTISLDRADLESLVECVVAQAAERISNAFQGGKGMSRAWVKQRADQVRTLGAGRAPWYCCWIDPDGHQRSKSCGAGKDGQRSAQKVRRKVEAQLIEGTYGGNQDKEWAEFRREYEDK